MICFSSDCDADGLYDLDIVTRLYEQGFVAAFDTYLQCEPGGTAVNYKGLGWGTADVPTLVTALSFAEAQCRPRDKTGKERI